MNKIIFRFFISLILSINLFASNSEPIEKLISSLSSEGFENIKIDIQESKLFLSYENRVYRFEIDGLLKVLSIIDKALTDEKIENINIVIQNKNVPIVFVNVDRQLLKRYMNKEIDSGVFVDNMEINFSAVEVWKKFENIKSYNSSHIKFDFILKPTYKFEFGLYSDPVRYQLNIAPAMEVNLWKGMTALYELTIPIHNDLLPREDTVRTTMIVFNQTMRLSNFFFASASLGLFTQNRYGADIDVRNYFLNGDLSVAVNVGYTGYASFSGFKLYYSNPYLWTGSCNVEYRFQEYDLTVGVMAGRFLIGDNTLRVDINRDFGEVQIGFFVLRSGSGISNGGINVSVPFFPSKHLKPKFIRLRTNESLAYSYLLKTNTDDLIGLRYNTGFRVNEFIERLNPGYVKNYFKNRIKNN